MRKQIGWLLLPDMSWLRRSVGWKTLLAVAGVGAVAVAAFVAVGGVPIAADQPDGWLTRHALHFVFKRSIAESARTVLAPNDLSANSRIRLGARQFDMVCANCHGAPGIGQSAVALSMSPRPQHLPRVVDQFTDAELAVIVKHGVKFSAMPSWPISTRDDEIWTMVAFLRQLPKMDAKTYLDLTAVASPPETTPKFPLDPNVALRPSDAARAAPPVEEFLYAAPSVGFGDRSLRTHPVAACAGCHGVDGDGGATGGEAPNLTIQDSNYLRAALDSYSRGTRKSGFMQEIASQLSTAQIGALADYYAALPVRTLAATSAKADAGKRGEDIALNGIASRVVAACANCHESAGAKLSGAPHIAGQSETFLRRQLTAMRSGGRGSTAAWNPMYAEAHALRDDEIASLAAYYSGLTPAKAGGAPMAPAWPGGDVAKGEKIFQTVCTKCHLNGGRGDNEGSFPDVRLQAAPYIVPTLHSFRSRIRDNKKMQEVTQDLSDADILNVAAYLNTVPPEPAIARPTKPVAETAAAIAEHGASDRGVPACLTCHGAAGVTALPLVSRLQGQSAPYLKARLELFAAGAAEDVPTLNPMPAIATKLTAQERTDLAAYFSALPPLPKPAAP